MCTVDGMLPSVPRTNSATSCTVNICSSSSKMAGNEFNRAAWGGWRRGEGERRCHGGGRGGRRFKRKREKVGSKVNNVSVASFCDTVEDTVNSWTPKGSKQNIKNGSIMFKKFWYTFRVPTPLPYLNSSTFKVHFQAFSAPYSCKLNINIQHILYWLFHFFSTLNQIIFVL